MIALCRFILYTNLYHGSAILVRQHIICTMVLMLTHMTRLLGSWMQNAGPMIKTANIGETF